MKKINNLTYLTLDECYLELENFAIENNLKVFNKAEIVTLVKGLQVEGNWYVSQCDLSFFTSSLEQPEVFKQTNYLGAIGIDLSKISFKGKILDIGGGGEGIIGQINGENTIAIDPLKEELEEAASGPVKIVMNAKDLLFIDHSFETVTSFFTFMYIPNIDHLRVFEEIYRVLKLDGEFIMWDVKIPQNINNEPVFIIFLEIALPNKKVFTGYGQKWSDKLQDTNYFIELGNRVGFQVESVADIDNNAFVLKFSKK